MQVANIAAAAAGEVANAYFGFIRAVVHRNDRKSLTDGRSSAKRKKKRTIFDHQRAADALDDDYLGTAIIPRFDDRQFELQFGVDRAHFDIILLAIGHGGNKFFCQEYDCIGRPVARIETRVLLALKTIVYGVAAYCFCDYFQMSPQLCRQCLIEFCSEMKKIKRNTGCACRISTSWKRSFACMKLFMVSLECWDHLTALKHIGRIAQRLITDLMLAKRRNLA